MCADQSLAEFLDDKGLDIPTGDHRVSSGSYIEWGRNRSETVLMDNVTIFKFVGRDKTISSILDNICRSILKPSSRKPIYFIHASPGMGKTRLFLEMVKIGIDDQKLLLLDDGTIEEKGALLEDILYIAISFNGSTPYNPTHTKITKVADILSHIFLRVMHIWLTNVTITEIFRAITTSLAAGELNDELLTLKSMLSIVAQRSGRKCIVLFVDEILKVSDREVMNTLVLSLNAVQDVHHNPFTLRVCFSALEVDTFASAQRISGRNIISSPLTLLSRDDTLRLVTTTTTKERERYLCGRSDLTDDQLIEIMTLLSGGHMRALEFVLRTLQTMNKNNTVLYFIETVCRKYSEHYGTNTYAAILLSFLGCRTTRNTQVGSGNESMTVGDMVASGKLMSSFSDVFNDSAVVPSMPLISLIQWAYSTSSKYDGATVTNFSQENKGANIAILIVNHFKKTFGTTAMTGKVFESVCILRHIIMRHVYKSLTDGVVLQLFTGKDWRNATLLDYFENHRCMGPISDKLASLKFDFTKVLPEKWDLLENDDIEFFFERNYTEKLTRLGQPTSSNSPYIDYFYSLVSNCGVVVTIVAQVKYSADISTTRISISDNDKIMADAIDMTDKFGAPRDTIVYVAELWCESPHSGLIDVPSNVRNTTKQTKFELSKQAGCLMTDLITLLNFRQD